jgi:membrane peptidoglycan carboxypeptidase
MVGGRSFFDDPVAGQVNNATALNQPGSAMKPITYLSAFEKGWNAATIIPDEPIQLDAGGRKYQLQNFDGKYSGKVSAREALGNSLNVPAVHALEFAGLDKVHDLSGQMGLTSLQETRNYGLAFTLGGADIKLLDLAYVFSVFAAGGEQHGMPTITESGNPRRPLDPTAVLRVDDARGNTIWEYRPRAERIAPATHVYQITHILSDNNARLRTFGPNNPLVLPGRPAAAKTGLTDDPRDAWTFGYTPQLVAGVWVGYKDNRPMPGASSVSVASPIWQAFMEAALKDEPVLNFDPPAGIQIVDVCKSTGRPPLGSCSEVVKEVFVAGQVPPPAAEPTQTPQPSPTGQPSPSAQPSRSAAEGAVEPITPAPTRTPRPEPTARPAPTAQPTSPPPPTAAPTAAPQAPTPAPTSPPRQTVAATAGPTVAPTQQAPTRNR